MSSIEPKRYHAFLSYNSQDRPAVKQVAERLKREKLNLYLEEWELAPGREFQPALADALHESRTCVVFLGPNGLGPWQKQELQVAIDKRARDEAFHVIPVLLPGTERPRRGDVAHLDFLINASWVEFLQTLDDERAVRSLVWGITGTRPPESHEQHEEGVCPYRGLEAFRPEDAQFFFGRENLTGWLVSSLRREVRAAQGVRFLGVLGPSGSGKSSVVLAGLVPKLKAGAIEGSERWPVAILRPGDDPLKNLAAGVVSRFLPAGTLPDVDEARKLINNLRADTQAFDLFAQMALRDHPGDVRLAVVVDQFEEVFTHRPQGDQARARFEQDRDQFFANLLHAAAAPGGRVAVVLTMRSDFLSACATFDQLAAVLSAHQELVGPMTAAELREAIEQPAFRVGCEVEPGLTERLLADVEGQPGALPLLQFALTEVWKKREVRLLTLRAYTELGKDDKGEPRGIEGVLEHRADEIYRSLKPEDQELCRWLFLQLVQPGEGTEDTKRRVSYRVLRPDDPTRREAVSRLIRTLADRDARLITTEGTDAADGAVEVAHEALVRGWTQLRRWVEAERAGLRIQRRLTEAAQEWAAARPEHKEDYLYSGVRLAVCREWVETHRNELSTIEAAFLAVSEEAERERKQDALENERRLRQAAEVMAEQQKVLAAEERRRRKLWMGLAAAVLAAVGLAAAGGLYWQNQLARRHEELALVRENLKSAEKLIEGERFAEATETLRRANDLLGKDRPRDLGDRHENLQQACHLAVTLELIQRDRTTWTPEGRFNNPAALKRYEEAFDKAGLHIDGDLTEVAERIRKSWVKNAIQEAIDNWALVYYYEMKWPRAQEEPQHRQRRDRLLELGREVNKVNPDPFRDRIRNPQFWGNEKELEGLAKLAQQRELPRRLAALLAELLRLENYISGNLEPLLRTYQSRYPDDFWLNYDLAKLLALRNKKDEALRFYQASLAIDPKNTIVLTNMASIFYSQDGHLEEAISHLERALSSPPDNVVARTNLGTAWRKKGELKRAIEEYQKALRINSKDVPALYLLGQALEEQGDREGAIERYEQALDCIPEHPPKLGLVFSRINVPAERGDLEAVIKKALDNVRIAKWRKDRERE
jgi:tetratricopeptide (TPR) repeat protein